MTFLKEKKYFIVADKEYKSVFYAFKAKYPFLDLQIISKSDLIDLLGFAYQMDPIPYLLKKEKYDYSQCKKLLNILRVGDISSHEEYIKIFDELQNQGYLKYDDLGPLQVKQREVLLFEADEDYELHSFLKRKGVPYQDIHFKDIDREEVYSSLNAPVIYDFDNKFLQYFYIFADIRKRVLSHPEQKDKITIFLKGDQDLFYVNFFSGLFGIDVFTNMKLPLISSEDVSVALSTFFKNKNFKWNEEVKENSPLFQVLSIIERYQLKTLSFDFAYSSLMEILSSQTMNYTYKDKGVGLSNELFFDGNDDPEHMIYVTNFQHDDFYKEFDDNNLLPDAQLERIGVNPSYIKTKLDRRKKLNFICYHHLAFASRALLHLKDKIYASQFLEEMKWKSSKPEKHNPLGSYTTKAKELLDSYYKDILHSKPDTIYRSYDHSYHRINHSAKRDKYGVTSMNTFFQCPFYYYLERVLSLSKGDKDNDKLAAYRGDLIHGVFEDIFTRDYVNLDKAYDEAFAYGLKKYEENARNDNHLITDEEKMYIRFIKKWLRDVVKTAILQKDSNISNITGEVAEKNVTFEVAGVQFTGQIDKIIYTKGASGQQYYTITDYKSGSSGTFELEKVFLGGSLQLPLYYLALQQKQNQEYTHNGTDHFGGFGIQHLYFANGIPTSDGVYGQKSISEKMRNAGIAYNDFDYAESFDSTAVKITKKNGKSLQKGVYRDFSCSFSDDTEKSSLISKGRKYTLEEFIQDAIAGTKKSIEAIENSLFDIAPTATKTGKYSDEFCKYCPYKDVCYHAKTDIKNITSEINTHFQTGKESSGSDDSDDAEDYSND